MKRELILCLGGLTLAGLTRPVLADAPANPYNDITVVNAFRLLPKPPPVVVDNTPPPSPVTIKITGIMAFGTPEVLLEITDATTKKVERPSPLAVGEKQGTVEIVAINVDKGEVTLKNSGSEMTLSFERDGIKPTVGVAPVATAVTPLPTAVATPFPGGTLTVPPSGGSGNVIMTGGSSSSGIPSRPVRAGGVVVSGPTDGSAISQPVARSLTREESEVLMEVQRQNPNYKGPPLPPTRLTPPGEGGTVAPPAPTPPGLPSIPRR